MTIATPDSRIVAHAVAWDEPEGLAPRGTLIVLGGRGETPAVYERFGSRIARDAYRVRALGDAAADADGVRRAAVELLADADLPSPKVLVGSDAGAALALEIAASTPGAADALVLAGLPTRSDGVDAIEARTACPNHQGVLARETTGEGRDRTLPPELLGITASAVDVPVLAIHGAADSVSPIVDAVAVHRQAPRSEVHAVAGGRHDILNDVSHRSVAATIVLFLERVRASTGVEPIVVRVRADA